MATTRPSHLFLLLLPLLPLLFTTTAAISESSLLLTFKSSLQSPSVLSSWSASTHPCNWTGVACSSSSSVSSLDLAGFNLSGDVSSSICLLPHLSHVNLAFNSFNKPIPLHLSQCTSLLSLNLSHNLIWGTLPEQLFQLSFLTVLDVSHNQIQGQIPLSVASLQALQVLSLGSNLITGTLHPSLFSNLTQLVTLDLSQNPGLASELPVEIGRLSKLRRVLLQGCGLYAGIPESILGLHELEVLDLSKNNLTGRIPLGFGLGLPKLKSLDLSQNKLYGSFPVDVCSGKALVELSLHANFFTGFVPDSIGRCSSLESIQLQDNGFYGVFPSALWTLPQIRIIRAENNRFAGQMPDFVGVLSRLEQIQIDNNSFTGGIPGGLGMIGTMYKLSASLNGFYGDLPENLCDSPVMSIMNLSHNSLSGSIPPFQKCRKLVSLSLAGNNFLGTIPSSLAHLPVLTYIDLSSNNLTGPIPEELQNLKLALFNVSFNHLSGTVPLSLVSGPPASFLQGNPGLCGPGLPNPCIETTKRKSSPANRMVFALIAIAFVLGFMLLALGLFLLYRLSQRNSRPGNWKTVFFYSLGITEDELLTGINEKNLIGAGAFGDVYKVRLSSGECIAVKELSNNGKLCFRTVNTEMRKLVKARHKNLAKLLGFCYSDNVVLVMHEYMSNGSLGDALSRTESSLEWRVLLKIAIGASQGLAYLHKDCGARLLHRNVKSNNILLDLDFEPKVMGFGIDRVIGETSFQSIMVSELASSSYLPPEQGCSAKATEQMDVYSFGVVLLELITGRKAEKRESSESPDVVTWVRRRINTTNGASQILDSNIGDSSQQEMLGVLELALRCVSVMPEKRPMMGEVVRSLQSAFCESSVSGDR